MLDKSAKDFGVSPENTSEARSEQESQDAQTATPQISDEQRTQIPENDGTPKQISQEKLEANRRNAQLSTGPRTAQGKATSSRNSIVHGLLINDVVIKTGAGQENEAEFDALLAELRDAYQPVGIAEDILVRELAVSYWRSARALRCERGTITRASKADPEKAELTEDPHELCKDAEARHKLLATSQGINFVLRKIESTKWEVRSSGSISAQSRRWLSPHKDWQRFYEKPDLLAALDKEAKELSKMKAQIELEEADEKHARVEFYAIPTVDALHRIQRYENGNVRHRYRVEQRLYELQSRRRAGAKPNGGRPN